MPLYLLFGVIYLLVFPVQTTEVQKKNFKKCGDLNLNIDCENRTPSKYELFGTKTTYEAAQKVLQDKNKFNYENLTFLIQELDKNYIAQKLYYFARHSIRTPKRQTISKMNIFMRNFINQSNDILMSDMSKNACPLEIEKLRNFKVSFTLNESLQISNKGMEATRKIGERLAQFWPSFFKQEVPTVLGISIKKRSKQTLVALLEGMNNTLINQNFTLEEHLFFHEKCKSLLNLEKLAFTDASYLNMMNESKLLLKIAENISNRLGLKSNSIKLQDLKTVYRLCSYERANFERNDWCNLFEDEELRILNYHENLDAYFDGGKHKINGKMACPAVKHIHNFLDPFNNTQKERVFLGISHSGALKPLLTTLEINSKLKMNIHSFEESYCNQSPESKWNVATDICFNANFMFVLYEKKSNDASSSKKYFVLTLLNEIPIKIGKCENILCSWKLFDQFFKEKFSNCNLQNICKI